MHHQRSTAALALLIGLFMDVSQVAMSCPSGCICTSSNLMYCRVSGIPRILFNNPVQQLVVTQSNIPFLSSSHLSNFTQITYLALIGNNIQRISSDAFRNNTRLESILLNDNSLVDLPYDVFRGLTQLGSLYVNGNNLQQLDERLFDGLVNLKNLYLNDNELTVIPFKAMKSLTSLQKLEMANNNIHCDCKVAWMKNFRALSRSDPILCTTPEAFAGRRVDDLTIEELNCAEPTVSLRTPVVDAYKRDLVVELACTAEGDPPPEISWYFNGDKIDDDSSNYKLAPNGSLLILNVRSALCGLYLCKAENLAGSSNATVELRYAGARMPNIVRGPIDAHTFENSSFTLTCRADHFAEVLLWEKEGYAIETESSRFTIVGDGVSFSNLTVLNARKDDAGVYYCLAEGEAGKTNASATVSVTGPVLTCDGILDRMDMEEFRENVDAAFNATQEELRNKPRTPGSLLRQLKYPDSGIIEHLKAAEIFDQAVARIRRNLTNITDGEGHFVVSNSSVPYLSECELEVLQHLSGCEEHTRRVDCSSCFHQHYRTFDGTCNNIDNPTWGASEMPFKRLQQPAYEDGLGLPVGWSGGKPSARTISQKLLSTQEVTGHSRYTHMLMQVGQFLDHDIDLAPIIPSDIAFDSSSPDRLVKCGDSCENNAPCFPIPVPENDTRIKRDCLTFTRSSAVCGTGAPSLLLSQKYGVHREQLNAITSYIDGSQIYGSTNEMARRLWEYDERGIPTGYLKLGQPMPSGKRLLPFDDDPKNSKIDCATGIHRNRSDCFLSGDIRVNEQVGLISMHTIFFREHNRIVTSLKELNPHWDGEKVYQEARVIVIAEWQNVIYTEYLPKILGADYLGDYVKYDPNTDASIANAFATAAYRFGHSQIMPFFSRLDHNYDQLPIGPLLLQHAFFTPFRILEEGGIDPLLRGLISTPVKLRVSTQAMNNNLTEALFAQAHEIGLDLASLNVQRGRDHGLPSYGKWRRYCGLSEATTIEQLQGEITNPLIRTKLKEIYGDDPDNIDLFVGGLLEDTLTDSQLGPTFRCIIGDQFKRLRNGDRFFYEREGQFSPDQLVQLRQASLSKIICDNADNISMVPVDAFVLQERSEFTHCEELPSVDLILWKECEAECGPVERSRRSALFKTIDSSSKYRELSERLIQLEEKINTCVFNGKRYGNGESWKLEKCIQCSCTDGQVECGSVPNCSSAAV